MKRNTKEYKELIKNKPITVLGKYQGSCIAISHQCDLCNHIWNGRPDNIMNKNSSCPECSKKEQTKRKKFTTEQYKEQIKNKTFIVVEEYKNAHTKTKHQCQVCDCVWTASPANIKKGSGCPVCFKNKTAYQKYKNKPTWLYYIFIPSKNLYKIGLAQKGTKNRYKHESFDIEIIQEELFEDGYEAHQKEQEIIQANKRLAWFPSEEEKFGGWTECFVEDIKEK